jgi:hypothetical protein
MLAQCFAVLAVKLASMTFLFAQWAAVEDSFVIS